MRLSLNPSTDPDDYRFVHRIRTRFAETDAMGIIHHGAYVPYLEEARAALLRHAGHPYDRGAGDGHRFRRPRAVRALPTAAATSTTWSTSTWPPADLTRTTFQVGYLLEVEGQTRATAVTVHGAVDPGGRPARMPSWLTGVVAGTAPRL